MAQAHGASIALNRSQPARRAPAAGTGFRRARRDTGAMTRVRLCMLLCLALGGAALLAAAADVPARGDRASFAAHWQAQGLQPVAKTSLDLLYLRPGLAKAASAAPVRVAPVQVQMRENWQSANRALERARLRPVEVQTMKDEVGRIVGEELQQAFGDAHGALAGRPVLEARVLDLYLNAPEMQAAVHSKTYTQSYGDMVLVAELRDGDGGPLLLGSWDHRPAREWVTPRLTTRVDNAIELRAAAHAWAKRLRGEYDRLAAGS